MATIRLAEGFCGYVQCKQPNAARRVISKFDDTSGVTYDGVRLASRASAAGFDRGQIFISFGCGLQVRYEIRQLHVGEVLDQAIALTKHQFKPLFWITIALFTPATILNGVVTTHLLSLIDPEQIETAQPVIDGHFWITLAATGVLLLFYWIIAYPISTCAVTHCVASAYLDKPSSFRSCYARAFRAFFPLFLTSLSANMAILVGSMCCWIPGIYLALIFSLSSQIVVIEGIWEISGLQRSFQLTKGSILVAIVLGLLLTVIYLAMFIGTAFIPLPQVASITSSLVQSCFFVFSSAAWVIFYFSCRCKTENFDLALLVDAVAQD